MFFWFSFTVTNSEQLRSCPNTLKFSYKPKDYLRALDLACLISKTLIETHNTP
jgi:hypothetical protein